MHFKFKVDNDSLTIMPATEEMKKFLTLRYRDQGLGGRMQWLEEPMFNEITTIFGTALQTYQGFWSSARNKLLKGGHTVDLHDYCLPVPEPRWDLTGGFRFSQKSLLYQGLVQKRSGLIGAPTRYGKTCLIINTLKAYPNFTWVVTAPGTDLCKQLYTAIKAAIPTREVKLMGCGSKVKYNSKDITVCSMDSLDKIDHGEIDGLLVDEPHAVAASTRASKISSFHRSLKIGFGATLDGRSDKKDRLIEGLIGPVLCNRTYLEAKAEGAVSPLKLVFLKVPFNGSLIADEMGYAATYRYLLTASKKVRDITRHLCDEVIPQDSQTMMFIRDEDQADFFAEGLDPSTTVAMAKKLSPKERDKLTEMLARNERHRCLASNIYVQGVTFSDLKVLINLAGGGGSTTAVQKPGRLLEIRPGKNYGVMVDIMFEQTGDDNRDERSTPYGQHIAECWARHRKYKAIGYDIEFVEANEAGYARIKELIDNSYS